MVTKFPSLENIDNCNDEELLRRLQANHEDKGLIEEAKIIRKRRIAVAAQNEVQSISRVLSDFENTFFEYLYAYEEALSLKNGKKTQARRLRNKLKTVSIKQTVSELVLKNGTDGFNLLSNAGLLEYSFENLVMTYKTEFPDTVVLKAEEKLNDVAE